MTLERDWYVLSRLGLDGASTATVLDILSGLATPLPDATVIASLDELMLCEPDVRVVGLPYVLDLVTSGSEPCSAAARLVALTLLPMAPTDLRPSIRNLVSRLPDRSFDWMDAVESLASHVLNERDSVVEEIPYFRVSSALAETILLSAIDSLASARPDVRSHLREIVAGENSPLTTLLTRAMSGSRGRMPLVLAARVLGHGAASPEGRHVIAVDLWTRTDLDPIHELDLLELTAWLEFAPDLASMQAMAALTQETVRFSALGGLHKARGKRRSLTALGAWEELGGSDAEVLASIWPICVARLQTQRTAMRDTALAQWIPLAFGASSAHPKEPKKQATGWAAIFDAAKTMADYVPSGARKHRRSDHITNVLLVSPWLSDTAEQGRSDAPRAALVRLLLAASLAADIVRYETVDDLTQRHLLRLIAHAATVCAEEPTSMTSGPWQGLMLHVSRKLEHLGTGRVPGATPAAFCNALDFAVLSEDGCALAEERVERLVRQLGRWAFEALADNAATPWLDEAGFVTDVDGTRAQLRPIWVFQRLALGECDDQAVDWWAIDEPSSVTYAEVLASPWDAVRWADRPVSASFDPLVALAYELRVTIEDQTDDSARMLLRALQRSAALGPLAHEFAHFLADALRAPHVRRDAEVSRALWIAALEIGRMTPLEWMHAAAFSGTSEGPEERLRMIGVALPALLAFSRSTDILATNRAIRVDPTRRSSDRAIACRAAELLQRLLWIAYPVPGLAEFAHRELVDGEISRLDLSHADSGVTVTVERSGDDWLLRSDVPLPPPWSVTALTRIASSGTLTLHTRHYRRMGEPGVLASAPRETTRGTEVEVLRGGGISTYPFAPSGVRCDLVELSNGIVRPLGIASLPGSVSTNFGLGNDETRSARWSPDTSAAYRAGEFRTVATLFDDEGVAQPVAFGPLVFIAAAAIAGTRIVTVCIAEGSTPNNLLVATDQGEFFELPLDMFDDAGRSLLADRALRENLQVGLLITLELKVTSQRLRLVLRTEPHEDDRYPRLTVPFDERNLEWARQFADSDTVVARRVGQTWKVRAAEVPGFPPELQAEFQSRSASRPDVVECHVIEFDSSHQRNAKIRLLQVSSYSLELHDPPALLDSVLSAGLGTTFRLTSAIPSQSGIVVGKTMEGLMVAVRQLDLAFGPQERNVIPDVVGRWVTVMRTGISPVGPGFDVTIEVPDVLRQRTVLETVRGIVVQVPKPKETSASLCGVLFEGTNSAVALDLTSVGRPRLGDIVSVELGETPWAPVRVEHRWFDCAPLWTMSTEEAPITGDVYVGETVHIGARYSVVQRTNDSVVLVPPQGLVRLLARWEGRWSGGTEAGETVAVTELKRVGGRSFVHVGMGQGRVAGGSTTAEPRRRMKIEGATITVKSHAIGAVVSREFDLRPIEVPAGAPKPPSLPHPPDLIVPDARDRVAATKAEMLASLESAGEPIEVVVSGARAPFVIVVELTRHLSQASCRVDVLDRSTQHVAEAKYTTNGLATLRFVDGRIVASCLDVPALSTDRLRESLGCAFDAPRDVGMYYVGSERIEGSTVHRFELGPGRTVVVDDALLTINGEPFSTRGLIIFHGDRVRRLQFVRLSFANDGSVRTGIDIDDLDIQWSPSRHLFAQASQHRELVHLIRIQLIDGEPRITSVERFDAERAAGVRDVTVANSEIDPADRGDLLELLQSSDSGECKIYGRLDATVYEETAGRQLVFRRARLTLEDGGVGDNAVVFMRATDVRTVTNDLLLLVGPAEGVPESEIGKDLAGVAVSRRNFSVRENRLARAADDKDGGIVGRMVLVHLRRGGDAKYPVEASMISTTIPDRKSSALASLVRGSRASYAVVMRSFDRAKDQTIRLEFQPGMTFQLHADEFVGPASIAEKTTVRIQLATADRFELAEAANAHGGFLPNTPSRPVTVLPMNELHKRRAFDAAAGDPRYWHGARKFSLAGLPEIIPWPGSYERQASKWGAPSGKAIESLMRTPHPKVALAGWDDRQKRVKFVPATDHPLVGRLTWDVGALRLSAAMLNGSVSTVPGHVVSCRAAPLPEIIDDARRVKWRLHDDRTVTWTSSGPVSSDVPHDDMFSTVHPFEEQEPGNVRLLPTMRRFRFRSFPADQFTDFLIRRPEWITVARVDSAGPSPFIGVEITPGRYVEIPGALLNWSFHGTRLPMDGFRWDHLAIGDRLRVEVEHEGAFGVDSIAITDIVQADRAQLGRQTSFLPVRSVEDVPGSLSLGVGASTIVIPWTWKRPSNVLPLSTDNEVRHLKPLEPGDTVLVGVRQHRFFIHGLSGWRVAIDFAAIGRQSGDARLFPSDVEMPTADMLERLIQRLGGAIVMTVTGANLSKRAANVDLSQQLLALDSGERSGGRVVARGGEASVLLRVGPATVRLPVQQVVRGLPEFAVDATIEKLIANRTWVWIHRSGGQLASGIGRMSGDSADVVPIMAVTAGKTRGEGLVVRDVATMQLAWAPKDELTWSSLSGDLMERLWLATPQQQRMQLVASAGMTFCSLTQRPGALSEADAMKPGTRVRVVIAHEFEENTGRRRYLVKSPRTGTLFEMRSERAFRTGEATLVEIERHTASPRIVIRAVPPPERTVRVEVPTTTPPPQLREPTDDPAIWWIQAERSPVYVVDAIGALRDIAAVAADTQPLNADAQRTSSLAAMVDELRVRALSSLHLEVLHIAGGDRAGAQRTPTFRSAVKWARSQTGETLVSGLGSLDTLIGRCYLEATEDTRALAAALLAATGRELHAPDLVRGAPMLDRLLRALRLFGFHAGSTESAALRRAVECLDELHDEIRSNAPELVLLPAPARLGAPNAAPPRPKAEPPTTRPERVPPPSGRRQRSLYPDSRT